jgi:glutamate-1-semialdehyde 2,1-aminomutase
MDNPRYQKSTDFLLRAEKSIPLGSQTFSKSKTQYPVGNSPLFICKAKGSKVWDLDGNRYVDLVNSLAAITLGYNNKEVVASVKRQLKKGTIFSLPGTLEAEVAELIVDTVPSAELVRFAKNGSDATSAAIRLSRAYTGRAEIAFCGYHGWADWYIGATTMNKGVPESVSQLTHRFVYNKIETLRKIFEERGKNIAAVILEPMNSEYPKNNFLQEVKKLANQYNAILIFDETITGYRYAIGGAQEEFGVLPDLTTLGKGIANGYPISAITGNKVIMKEMEKVFFSGTFGGELLSLAAAKTVIQMHQSLDVTSKLRFIGDEIASKLQEIIIENEMTEYLEISGHPTWKFLNWKSTENYATNVLKTYFIQEMLAEGILVLSTHNVSLTMNEKIIKKIIVGYEKVLGRMNRHLKESTLLEQLKSDPLKPLFAIR